MSDQYTRDRTGHIIGRFDGNRLRGGTGKPVARYVSSVDKTLTREGTVVGSGDLRLFQLGKNQPDK